MCDLEIAGPRKVLDHGEGAVRALRVGADKLCSAYFSLGSQRLGYCASDLPAFADAGLKCRQDSDATSTTPESRSHYCVCPWRQSSVETDGNCRGIDNGIDLLIYSD
jgi:hypothetical protein